MTATRLVLIVEREGQARQLEARFLQELGLEVESVADGATALERAREQLPALVVTAILVPRLDGLALCRQLKEAAETRHIPVLVVSVLSAAARARAAGADGFLLKPLSQERLAAEVARLVPAPKANAMAKAEGMHEDRRA